MRLANKRFKNNLSVTQIVEDLIKKKVILPEYKEFAIMELDLQLKKQIKDMSAKLARGAIAEVLLSS